MSKNGKIVRALQQAQRDTMDRQAHAELRNLHQQALRLDLTMPGQLHEANPKCITWLETRQRYVSDGGLWTASLAEVHGLVVALTNATANHNPPAVSVSRVGN